MIHLHFAPLEHMVELRRRGKARTVIQCFSEHLISHTSALNKVTIQRVCCAALSKKSELYFRMCTKAGIRRYKLCLALQSKAKGRNFLFIIWNKKILPAFI